MIHARKNGQTFVLKLPGCLEPANSKKGDAPRDDLAMGVRPFTTPPCGALATSLQSASRSMASISRSRAYWRKFVSPSRLMPSESTLPSSR